MKILLTVLSIALLYRAWGKPKHPLIKTKDPKHFLIKTKDPKHFLIETKDDHVEPIATKNDNINATLYDGWDYADLGTDYFDYIGPKTCGENEYKMILTVKTRFVQRSVDEANKHEENIRSSKSFKKKLKEITSGDAIGLNFGFSSVNAEDAFSSLIASIESSEKDADDIKGDKKTFDKGSQQIFRETVTEVHLDGIKANMVKKDWITSVPKDKLWSDEKLLKKATDHMEWEFGEGVSKNNYAETVCRNKYSIMGVLKKKETSNNLIWTSNWTEPNSGVEHKDSCWHPQGQNILASIGREGFDEDFKSYSFSERESVLDPPKYYELAMDNNDLGENSYHMWRPICNEGYVALGDLCTSWPLTNKNDEGDYQPSKEQEGNFKCVKKHLTKSCGKTQIDFLGFLFQSNDEIVQGVLANDAVGEERKAYCLNDVVEAKICGKDEYKVTLTVTTRFRQTSFLEISEYEEKTRSSKSFRKKLNEMSKSLSEQMSKQKSKEGSFNVGTSLFNMFSLNAGGSTATSSAAANAFANAFSSLNETIENSEEDSKIKTGGKKIFNDKFTQIFRETETQVNIDGITATTTKTEYSDSVQENKAWSPEKLREQAENYMKYEYGKGVNKNRFTNTVCIKK